MDQTAPQDDEQADLLSTLEVIEAQPLATRAAAYEGCTTRSRAASSAAARHVAPSSAPR